MTDLGNLETDLIRQTLHLEYTIHIRSVEGEI
jgi:hypothetical protein